MTSQNHECLFESLSARLHARFGQELTSMILFSAPFSNMQRGALVVVADSTPSLQAVLAEAGAEALQQVHVICLRNSELYQLALPNPMVPWTLGMPYWIREGGEVIRGRDVRGQIPYYRRVDRLLANHLAATAYRLRNRAILGCLAAREYAELYKGLQGERALLMCTALLLRSVWRVFPDTVVKTFLEMYPEPELRENIAEFAALRVRLEDEPADGRKRVAYRSVWLFETFLRRLWAFVP
jgi:hypothetical protein